MRRADRLFQIIQILRRSTRPVTASALAAELEVSKRTVYRDVADLIGQRVPIEGEAGLGYLLAAGYDMPPLMLAPDELEAVVLGAQWVSAHSDKALANAARDVVAKIAAVVPERLRLFVIEPSVGAKPTNGKPEERVDASLLRSAIRNGMKLRLRYNSEASEETERTVWPVILGYAETSSLLVAWCELRQGFRHFRTDRIAAAEILDEPIGLRSGELRRRWQRWREEQVRLSPHLS
ncbi:MULTISPECIES: YafY family protein [unclassified Rhizobium]|jgi:predicted DNA-binding transcriptional regulator YafY|uniref:helix-turn-helix transcriptional regulator n=1 Tax=unclassified Rhizobium TaxID=2613769 RepID=UPI000DE0497A|nr:MULTISPECIES: YafY family protein [unclassified Rhizobium]MBB3286098.1 putative DNA-binding transcriptional regulator YafY [Rhizobium sp. BK252]MBB3400740.1 putative DNA-binding transcriptional regulator YafY [Rhizobium sp. BK289]MBB3413416.1 putative DNA-binding transcriptional regulator YafY [Rhizobium sp. BK284]MBB3481206.1 putative DNA-binding transcriptional regulator YafY [Rhizobium sp. BK347]